jgi:hypothetical protein
VPLGYAAPDLADMTEIVGACPEPSVHRTALIHAQAALRVRVRAPAHFGIRTSRTDGAAAVTKADGSRPVSAKEVNVAVVQGKAFAEIVSAYVRGKST